MNARLSVLVVALIGLSLTVVSCSDETIKLGCEAGLRDCAGACVDASSDNDHCGGCALACKADQVCSEGACASQCSKGRTACEGGCQDTHSSRLNCGDCGVECGAGQDCVEGRCACTDDLAECGGACVDTESDAKHCGKCDHACASGEECTDGSCDCPKGRTPCSDSEAGTSSCKNLESDASNCGACGTQCTGEQRCRSGVCSCAEDQEECDGDCVPEGTCNATTSTGAGGTTSTSTSTSQGGAPSTVSSTGSGDCSISIEDDISDAIATVGIVTFEVGNIELTKAEIEFTRVGGGPSYVAPVDLDEPDHRTLLLGMKGESEYEYRIILNDGECTSGARTITTGPVPSMPPITKDRRLPDAAAPGFMVTSGGIGSFAQGAPAFIIDSEGDVVWWAASPGQCTRAKMDWEGKHMYMMALNLRHSLDAGEVRRVSMDGLLVETKLSGLNGAHHDFTVTPGGNVVAIVHQPECSGILERTPAGAITTIVDNIDTIYVPVGDCHPNSIHYHPEDESFTISDRNPDLFVKISRTGELEWQFGGTNPIASVHYQGTWSVNHGHQILPNGHFLFFNNGGVARASAVLEFELTTPDATEVWSYAGTYSSPTLGDVQRLPNGNTLITYSNDGVIQEIDSDKQLVQEFSTQSFGYVEHRPTLYGPPPR